MTLTSLGQSGLVVLVAVSSAISVLKALRSRLLVVIMASVSATRTRTLKAGHLQGPLKIVPGEATIKHDKTRAWLSTVDQVQRQDLPNI